MDLTFNDTFDLSNYGGKFKLFKVNPLKLDYTFTLPVEAITPEGKEVQKLVTTDWTKQMKVFKAAKEKEYKEIIAEVEVSVMKMAEKKRGELEKQGTADERLKLLKEWIDREVDGVKVMIGQALTAFEGVVKKQMDLLWAKLAAAVDKKFKTAITKKKVIAVLKIIGLATLIVAVGAASIAIGVLGLVGAAHSGGVSVLAAVAMAAGGVATIAAAAKKIVDVYSANWPTHKRSAKLLEEKLKALQAALAYENKKIGKTNLGPKEKIKLMLGNVKGKKEDLNKAIKDTYTWTMSMKQDIEKDAKADQEMALKIAGIKNDLSKEKDNKKLTELNAAVLAYEKHLKDKDYALKNAQRYLKSYEEMLKEAEATLKDESNFTETKLGETLDKIGKVAASEEVGLLVEAGKTGAKLLAAVFKLLKALKP